MALLNTLCEKIITGGKGAAAEIIHTKKNNFKRLVIGRASRNNNFISIQEQGILEEEGVKSSYDLSNEDARTVLKEACREAAIILESDIKVFTERKLRDSLDERGNISEQAFDSVIALLVSMHIQEEQARKICETIVIENRFKLSNNTHISNSPMNSPHQMNPQNEQKKTILLKKASTVNLNKYSKKMDKLTVGLGWTINQTGSSTFDLDVMAVLLKSNNKVSSDSDFIFYNNLSSSCGSVKHCGDNRTGAGEGDDEQILIITTKIPTHIEKILFFVNIHDAENRNQNFSNVSEAYIRIIDNATSHEIARYNLSNNTLIEMTMIFGELYRQGHDWNFNAIGEGFKGDLYSLLNFYGVNV